MGIAFVFLEKMSITPDQFLDFAEQTIKSESADEFDYRNAASRAYYSAFHCCLSQRLRCPDLSCAEISGSHDRLYKRFESLSISDPENVTVKKMAYVAKQMKSVRHRADYMLDQEFPVEEAQQQVSDAKAVIKHWKTLP